MTGSPDGQAVIERLERAHVFTIPLAHQQRWYRSHHLFRGVMLHQLLQSEPGTVFELHRRDARSGKS